MLKTLNNLGIDETHLKITKAIYDKLLSQYHIKGAKARSTPVENQYKIKMPPLTPPIQHSIGSSGQGNQGRERNKRYSNRKRGSQIVSVCRQYDFIFRKLHHFSLKTSQTDKQLQQSLTIQNQCEKITIISIHQ